MLFVNPYFLFGLLAISIPVIIHLFNFRKYKRIYFPNVKFIKEIHVQTQKQSRLKHLIVLTMRILAIASLVFAFAQPYIPLTEHNFNNEASSAVSIYIDNSFSMEAQSENAGLIEDARDLALEITSAYKAGDVFQLLSNDFEGIHQRFVTRDEFIEMLNNIDVTSSVRFLADVQHRQLDLMNTMYSKNKLIYMISDFQKSVTNPENFIKDTNVNFFILPLKSQKSPNILIDTCWFESPVHLSGQNVKLFVRIRNHSGQDVEKVSLKLFINDNQKNVSSIDIPSQSFVIAELMWNDIGTGIKSGVVEVEDSPVIYDDKFFFSYSVIDKIPVLCIDNGSGNIYLNSLLGRDSTFRYNRISYNNVDYSSFSKYNLIIIDGLSDISTGLAMELKNFTKEGGSIILIPSANSHIESYNNFLGSIGTTGFNMFKGDKRKISKLNIDHPVFNDVFDNFNSDIDLPEVYSYFPIIRGGRAQQQPIITLDNGDIFLSNFKSANANIYLLSAPLNNESSTFQQHAIFVPVMFRIAMLSKGQNKLFYTLGNNEKIEFAHNEEISSDQVFKIRKITSNIEFVPEQKKSGGTIQLYVHNQVKDAGNYMISNGEQNYAGLSFNYDRKESQQECYTPEELKIIFEKAGIKNINILDANKKNISKTIENINIGIRLWKLFIILALCFLGAEVLILRFWK